MNSYKKIEDNVSIFIVGTRAYHTLDRVAQGTPATSTRRPPKVTRWHSTNVDDISFEKSYHEEFRNFPLKNCHCY